MIDIDLVDAEDREKILNSFKICPYTLSVDPRTTRICDTKCMGFIWNDPENPEMGGICARVRREYERNL